MVLKKGPLLMDIIFYSLFFIKLALLNVKF